MVGETTTGAVIFDRGTIELCILTLRGNFNAYRGSEALQQRDDDIAILETLLTKASDLTMAERAGWRCFHCGDVMRDEHAARLHFGMTEFETPACLIKGAEGGLLRALRDTEAVAYDCMARLEAESAEGLRALAGNLSRHHTALCAAEEVGYERGLADGRAGPLEAGSAS